MCIYMYISVCMENMNAKKNKHWAENKEHRKVKHITTQRAVTRAMPIQKLN